MIWLLITIAMGAGVVIGITAYASSHPTRIELTRQTPCEYDQLDDDYRETPPTRPVSNDL